MSEGPKGLRSDRTHHINREAIEVLCFELVNVFGGSRAMAEEIMATAAEAAQGVEIEESKLWDLQSKFSETAISRNLLHLALLVRTYDDVLAGSARAIEYQAHVNQTQGDDRIGGLDDGTLNLREACNKIIHARSIRPLYEDVDPFSLDDQRETERIWYLTGEIELTGSRNNNAWNAVLWLQPFLEVILNRISFGDAEA